MQVTNSADLNFHRVSPSYAVASALASGIREQRRLQHVADLLRQDDHAELPCSTCGGHILQILQVLLAEQSACGYARADTPPASFPSAPPMGSTRPRRVISPVMATSCRTARLRDAQLISAVAMVTPAAGAVLGHRALGYMDVNINGPCRKSGARSRASAAWARIHDSAASALSFITSPS